jgi:hypothetical protein
MAETDYSSMTNDELLGLVNKGSGSPSKDSGVSKKTNDELLSLVGQGPSVAADVAKSLGSGAVRGTFGLADLPGSISQGAIGLAERVTGRDVPEWAERGIMAMMPAGIGMHRAISGESLTDTARKELPSVMDYKPKTTEGRYAGTVGEFIPGAAGVALTGGGSLIPTLARTALQSVVPGVASEYAGQAAEEYLPNSKYAEPIARLAGAMLGGIGANSLENAARGLISPGGGAVADDLAHAARLREAGIPVSAGLATKSPKVLGIEANNPKLQAMYNLSDNSPQYQGLTTAALREAGLTDEMISFLAAKKAADPAILGSPALANKFVMDELYTANGKMFDDALDGINIIPLRRLSDPIYKASTKPNAPSAVDEAVSLLGNSARTGTTVPARELHRIRSELGKDLSSLDGSRAEAARMARDAIDDLIDNAAAVANSPEKIAMLNEARKRHQALLVMQNAVKNSKVRGGANGVVTPNDLVSALERVYGRRNVTTGNVKRMGKLAESGLNTFGSLGKGTSSGWKSALPFGELLLGGGGALGALQGAAMYGIPLKLAAIPAGAGVALAGGDAARRLALGQLEKYAHTPIVQKYLENQLANPTTGLSGMGTAVRSGAAGYPSYGERTERKSGGRVGSHDAEADRLVMAAERAKRGLSAHTEGLLNTSDDSVASALEIANRSI